MRSRLFAFLALAFAVALMPALARCCPFCGTVARTFSEEIHDSDVAVIARLIEVPAPSADASQNASATIKPAKFQILKVLKGQELLKGKKDFETLYFGTSVAGTEFLAMAFEEKPQLAWSTPIEITTPVKPYLETILTLSKEGPDRLAFFQNYLESGEDLLARDAYDEFAKAPYKDVIGLKDRMKHEQLVQWIKDPKITASHRRLYLTMLGVCGNKNDAEMLEAMIENDSPAGKAGLDAMVAAYLTLKGPEGVSLIEDRFLKNKDAEYTETYATIMALRFHGQEEKIIPKQRLIEALRCMLDRPQLADLVIPDLARWEDWGSMESLVKLFKESNDETDWVRVPVINFLRACPLPEAKKHLEEIAKTSPEIIKRADSFFPLNGGISPPVSTDKAEGAKDSKPQDKTEKNPAAAETSAEDIPDASKFVDPDDQASLDVRTLKTGAQASATPMSRVGATAVLLNGAGGGKAGTIPTSRVMAGIALAGVALFMVMAAILRGGQHIASS